MEQYKDEKAFLKAEDIVSGTGVSTREGKFYYFHEFLSKYKAYLIDQAKEGKLTLQECKDQIAEEKACTNWGIYLDSPVNML